MTIARDVLIEGAKIKERAKGEAASLPQLQKLYKENEPLLQKAGVTWDKFLSGVDRWVKKRA